MTDILSYRFGSLNMIPDVTPNGVFYLPPTGWLTSFYNPPYILLHPSSSKKVASEKATKTETITSSSSKKHKAAKEDSSDKVKDDDSDDSSSVADINDSEATSASTAITSGNQTAQPAQSQNTTQATAVSNYGQTASPKATTNNYKGNRSVANTNNRRTASRKTTQAASTQQPVTVEDGMNFSYRAAQKAGVIDNNTSVEEFYKNAKEGNGSVTYKGQTVYYKANGNGQYQVTTAK